MAAARAFKASLRAEQRAKLQYSFDSPDKKVRWSNVPTNIVPRNGLRMKDLSSAQVTKLRTLLRAILSAKGFADEEGIRKADTYVAQHQRTGQGGRRSDFGSGFYYVALFGTPSRERKWTVQLSGHHLAIHMTFSGASVSNTPYFFGAEPGTPFKVSGKTYAPIANEAAALFGAARSLSSSQKAKAKLGKTFDDVLVGRGRDGQFPAREGITVASLSASQQRHVTAAIRTYVGDMPSAKADRRMATYRKQYEKTKLAWSRSTDASVIGAYVRLHGPRLWIEIVSQNGVAIAGIHYHSIERDIRTDYGAGT